MAVGVPFVGRTEQKLERLLGFFVNTLVLRARLDDTLTVAGLLAQVRETALDAYDHQEVPFDLLVERMQTEPTSAARRCFRRCWPGKTPHR